MSIDIAPRAPEKAPTLYRGVVMPLGQRSLELLRVGGGMSPPPEDGEQLYHGAAKGIHVSSDVKTARVYADNRSFITQQNNPAASRDPEQWTIGVLNQIDNPANRLDATVAKPDSFMARFEKWVSHYGMGRTEFVIPEVPSEGVKPKEVYLFQGDILHATFSDIEVALTALEGHIKHLEAEKLGSHEEGEFIAPQTGATIDRRISTIDTRGFVPAVNELAKSKVRRAARAYNDAKNHKAHRFSKSGSRRLS